MRRSFWMNVDDCAEFFLPLPSSTVVIEMNMRRKKLSNMLGSQPALSEFAHDIGKHISRTAVDHDEVIWRGFDNCNANDLGSVQMEGID